MPVQSEAAPEAKVIIRMAAGIHDAAAVPVWRAPAAPVFVRTVFVKDEPASLHLGDAQCFAAAACHLIRAERQVHMLSRIAVEVVHVERAMAGRKTARGIGV